MCRWGWYWMRLIFTSIDRIEHAAFPKVGGTPSDQLKTWTEQRGWIRGKSFHLPAGLRLRSSVLRLRLKPWLFLGLGPASFWTRTYMTGFPGSQGFGQDWNYTLTLLGVQLVDCRSRDFSGSVITWANSLQEIVCLSACLSFFLSSYPSIYIYPSIHQSAISFLYHCILLYSTNLHLAHKQSLGSLPLPSVSPSVHGLFVIYSLGTLNHPYFSLSHGVMLRLAR